MILLADSDSPDQIVWIDRPIWAIADCISEDTVSQGGAWYICDKTPKAHTNGP